MSISCLGTRAIDIPCPTCKTPRATFCNLHKTRRFCPARMAAAAQITRDANRRARKR
jgi:hypothetical protein